MSEFIPEDLFVGEPVLTVRWRLQNNALPLKNRHLRAFGKRGVTIALQSWARQHLEWTLAEGSLGNADGVLTLAVDDQGRAVMGIEPYEPLEQTALADLLDRVRNKAGDTVEDEVVWVCREGALHALTDGSKPLSGANSLVADLAGTLGTPSVFDQAMRDGLLAGTFPLDPDDEAFLVSDEYGVVAASDHDGPTCHRYAVYYERLAKATKADAYDRANLGLGM